MREAIVFTLCYFNLLISVQFKPIHILVQSVKDCMVVEHLAYIFEPS